jgi:hypothetical protein
MRLSVRNFIFTGVGGFCIFGTASGIGNGLGNAIRDGISLLPWIGLDKGLGDGWIVGLSVGLSVGLLSGLWYGGFEVVKHYILRFMLWWNNDMPFNYIKFLDYAADRIFLQKVGGGYIFVHRLLMEHFADMYPADEK